MTQLSVLDPDPIDIDRLEIATPCSADWDGMLGDDRVRFCLSCEKNVYNLSEMTRGEIEGLIEATEGVFCGRLFRRADGTVLTADCPVGLAERAKVAARRAARRTLALAALFVVTLVGGTLGFFSLRTKKACDVAKPTIEQWQNENVAGGLEVPLGGEGTPPEPVREVKGDVALPPGAMGGMRVRPADDRAE